MKNLRKISDHFKTELYDTLDSFISFIFPKICVYCRVSLLPSETVLCTKCIRNLPLTSFESLKDNPVEKKFRGKVYIENAVSLLYYEKGQLSQKLVHALKYKGLTKVGYFLGQILGEEVKNTELSKVDYIIPIPLHPVKEWKRGYNQSKVIAKGMAQAIGAKILTQCLVKSQSTGSQTKRSVIERWENVQDVFYIKDIEKIKNKHILIVDDVVTTGATIESACLKILEAEGAKVSVAALAHVM